MIDIRIPLSALMRIHFLLRFSCDARRYPDSQNTSGIPDGVHAEPVRQTVASGKAIEEREDASLYKENFRPFFLPHSHEEAP
ncbi:protein of unknown function [Agrobacterium pusense]|uniref:Uncharacterized protein n=1 Tax=Agrobacterium pusense TaxID=648995 RepID=U4QE88_9HYPH|nr:protein of unknown function [Agrobacterium pusense]